VMRRDDDEESWPLDVFFEPTEQRCVSIGAVCKTHYFRHLRMAGSYMTLGGVWVI